MFEDIEYETSSGIATVAFARPEVRNALRTETLTEFVTALDDAEADESVYVVLLTGRGPAFCAGGDHTLIDAWRDSSFEAFEADLRLFQVAVERLRSMRTPSVAAVNGPAVGAGCDIALACDLRVVSPEATLSEGFVHLGLLSGDGGGWLLPRLIGEAKAKEYLLTGKAMEAPEIVDLGLAVLMDDDVLIGGRELAERLRDLPPEAVQRTKRLATMRSESLEQHLERALAAQWACLQDEEHEAIVAARRAGRDFEPNRP